jgi:DNA-binding GntR family transcriptional regulator
MTHLFNISSTNKAYVYIKDLMFAHKLIPGQKLIYRDLEEILGLSKTPIISALSRLEQEGLVTSKRNCGYYVKRISDEEIDQFYDLRKKLEEISIVYAVQNHKKEDLVELKNTLDEYNLYDNNLYDLNRFKLDVQFHIQIAQMGGNDFLSSVLRQFYENAYILLDVISLTPLIPKFKKDHENLYEAIVSKNLRGAKKIIKQHEQACHKTVGKAMKN